MGMLIVIPFVSLSINYVFLIGVGQHGFMLPLKSHLPGHEMSVYNKKSPMGREIISPPQGAFILGNRKPDKKCPGKLILFFFGCGLQLLACKISLHS